MTPSLLLALAAPALAVVIGATLGTPTSRYTPRTYVVAAAGCLALGLVVAAWLLL